VLKVVHDDQQPNDNDSPDTIGGSVAADEIVRDGARQMLAAALRAEIAAYIDAHADELDEHGRPAGGPQRSPRTAGGPHRAAGAVPVRAPRVNDKRVDEVTGERKRFSSTILPAWARKSPQVAEVLPPLYLHGLSSGDFLPALEQRWMPSTHRYT